MSRWNGWIVRAVLVVAAVVLFAWDRAATKREQEARDSAHRIGRLVPAKVRDGLDAGGITVESGRGERFVYARGGDGQWRCTSYHGARGDSDLLDQFVRRVLEAEGRVVTREPSRAREFGFGLDTTWTVRVHPAPAPAPDAATASLPAARFFIEVGGALADPDRCFARRDGLREIWRLDDVNLRKYLDRPPNIPLPPMLEYTLVPRQWLGAAQRLAAVHVRTREVDYRLELRRRDVSDEALRRGEDAYEWVLHDAQAPAAGALCPARVASTYLSYLLRVPYVAVVGPLAAAQQHEAFANPAATIRFVPDDGPALEVVVGASAPDGTVHVWCDRTGLLMKAAGPLVNLMFPLPETLLTEVDETPWSRFLR